jgi:hypothetical protein
MSQTTCSADTPVDPVPPPVGPTDSLRARPCRRVGRPPIEDSIEVMVPSQFHRPASEAWWPGEKRLMLAVLTDAIEILTKGPGANGSHRRRLFAETWEWLACDDADWPCSFVGVCDALGLDVRAVRQALTRRVEQEQRRRRHVGADRPVYPAAPYCSSFR